MSQPAKKKQKLCPRLWHHCDDSVLGLILQFIGFRGAHTLMVVSKAGHEQIKASLALNWSLPYHFPRTSAQLHLKKVVTYVGLKWLNLYACKQVDNLGFLCSLQYTLTVLSLSNCTNIPGSEFIELGCLARLKSLDLSHTAINCTSGLVACVALTDLNTSWCNSLEPYQFLELGTLTSLRDLNVSFCVGFDDSVVAGLPWNQLIKLDLTGIELQSAIKLDAERCSSLRSLHLRGVNKICSLSYLYGAKNLTDINLFCCDTVTDELVMDMCRSGVQLTHLNLCRCPLTDKCLDDVFGQPLVVLDLSYCVNLTDAGFSKVMHHKTLQKLNVSECSNMTDETVRRLATVPNLTNVNLSYCYQITNDGLSQMSTLPLHRVKVYQCKKINFEKATGELKMMIERNIFRQ